MNDRVKLKQNSMIIEKEIIDSTECFNYLSFFCRYFYIVMVTICILLVISRAKNKRGEKMDKIERAREMFMRLECCGEGHAADVARRAFHIQSCFARN